ncbi:MAG: glutamyl-tRNA reductase [Pseudomonadota bacterium]|nr:glutamyl-tRNA reductase [Pseudomonadota bacterium]
MATTTIFCIGISYRNANLSLREELLKATNTTSIATIRQHVQELVVLSTCNRFELYGTIASQDLEKLPDLFCAAHQQHEQIRAKLYLHTEDDALKHILSVISGIDSLIIGETQIVKQVKEAFARAANDGTSGVVMQEILRTSLSVSKKIRTHTEIGSKVVSISHAAIGLCDKIFANPKRVNILIVGAGEMATIAARYACKRGVNSLAIANRNLARAEALCAEIGCGQAHALTSLPDIITAADVVLTATTADHIIITRAQVEKCLPSRKGRALALIDISLPRNIDPSCQGIEDLYLFDLDDLKQITAQNTASRQSSITQAQQYVEQGVAAIHRSLEAREMGAVVAKFKDFLQQLAHKQTAITLAKANYDSLTLEQRQGITHLTDTIVDKIVGSVGLQLKSEQRHHILALLRKLVSKSD